MPPDLLKGDSFTIFSGAMQNHRRKIYEPKYLSYIGTGDNGDNLTQIPLNLFTPFFLSCKSRLIDLRCKSIDWFLHDGKINLKCINL